MTENKFHNWQLIGGTDELIGFAKNAEPDSVWSVAHDGDELLFRVTTLELTLQDRINTWADPSRRQSHRINGLAEIAHIVEDHPNLWDQLSEELQSKIDRPECDANERL